MRFCFFVIFLLCVQTPVLCDFKPYVLDKKTKLDDKLIIKTQKNTLVFDWLKHTKTALAHLNSHGQFEEWWFVFDDLPKVILFPDDHDLPVGVLSLRQEQKTSVEKTHLIIKIKINKQFEFKVSKKSTAWSIQAMQKKSTKQRTVVPLDTNSWPHATYLNIKNNTPYTVNILDIDKDRRLIFCLMDKNIGLIKKYETPFYKTLNSVHGGGTELFNDDVKILKNLDKITVKVITPLKPQHNAIVARRRPLPAQIGIFKNYDEKTLLAYINTYQDLQTQSTQTLENLLPRSWVEMMIGNEHATLSFIRESEKDYPGIMHHPFVRALKTVAYIMDTNFIKAQENSLYLPKTAENILLTALIETAKGATIARTSDLRIIRSIYTNYTRSIRDEIMGPVFIALIDLQDYETLEILLNNIPEPKTFQFRGYFKYAKIMLELSKDKAGVKFQKLGDFTADITFGKLSQHLQAHALFQKLLIDIRAGTISAAESVKQLTSLSYMWRGDQFEAQTLLKLATILMKTKQYRQALHYFQRLKDSYISMYKILHLHKKMETCFVKFFKENIEKTSPLRVISFYEAYKEYTPNSDEETNIIKTVARTFMKLDLLEQSAALLTSAAKNKNRKHIFVDFYLDAAQLHIDNQDGELALSTLKAIPPQEASKHSDLITMLSSRAHASMGQIDKALQILDEKSTVSSLKLAADLLIEKKDWDGARKRLFQLVLKLDDDKHKDVKSDALLWLAMINILTDRIYDNQALIFMNTQFINKLPDSTRKTFELLTNDKEMQTMTRYSVEKQLKDTGMSDFYDHYMKKKK